jgi:hypothetical protein
VWNNISISVYNKNQNTYSFVGVREGKLTQILKVSHFHKGTILFKMFIVLLCFFSVKGFQSTRPSLADDNIYWLWYLVIWSSSHSCYVPLTRVSRTSHLFTIKVLHDHMTAAMFDNKFSICLVERNFLFRFLLTVDFKFLRLLDTRSVTLNSGFQYHKFRIPKRKLHSFQITLLGATS